MKHPKLLTSIISAILTLALLCGLVPTTVFAAPEDRVEVEEEDYPKDVVDAVAHPMLGVQSGVQDVTDDQEPRTREELLALDGVTLTEDGQLTSVKTSLLNELSEEERSILWGLMPVGTHSASAPDSNAELREQFGLTDSEIEQGVYLHGDMLVFTSELSDLAINQEHMTVSDQQMDEMVHLVASGYTCSQAILALAAKEKLGLSLDALKTARVAECETELLATADESDTFNEPEADVADYLAEKTGLPKALVTQLIDSGDMTAYQLDQTMEGALSQAYPRPSMEQDGEAPAVLAADNDRTLYAPKEVLGKPYTYDQQGNFDVNLSNGSYSYSETDLSIPGKNGLDLVLTRQYHADRAHTTYSMGAIDPEVGYQYNITNETAFVVHCKWYEIKNDGTPIRELTDLNNYTLDDPAGNTRARRSKKFSLSEYYSALAYLEEERNHFLGWQYGAEDLKGNAYGVAIIPTITGMADIVEEYLEIMEYEDSYLVDEFGLGHGWMLGISHLRMEYPGYGDINEDERQFRLTTSDGTQYYIEKYIGTTGNYIENYEGNDIMFHKCSTGEYPNAVYGLYHKDGKVEYFDNNGRNIAIADRYGNKITLAYTFTDTTQSQVSKIEITDTLNNTIIYEKVALDPNEEHTIKSQSYNSMWRLSLNGQTIREYYTNTSTKVFYSIPQASGLPKDYDTHPVQLVGVKNENGELTRYYGIARRTRFNCFLQPAVRSTLNWDKPLHANDGYQVIVEMYRVFLPNGAVNEVGLDYSQETFGNYGYRSNLRCDRVQPLSSSDISSTTVHYLWGDFDIMDGIRTREDNYYTTAKYEQKYLYMMADGTMAGGGALYRNYNVQYTFNPDGQLIKTEKHSHKALDCLQEYIPEGYDWGANEKVTWKAETVEYSYSSQYARKPYHITTTHFNPSGEVSMTASQSYTYDDKWNVKTYAKPNGSKETYTYDSTYNLPLIQTVQQDANTTITVTNTLTADKKSIASSTVSRNGTVVGKTTFSYNSAGQTISQNDYLSSANYVTTAYGYGSGALPTSVSVSGVKTASGTTAAGSPGFTAGTVARKQAYNDRGRITSETDARGKTTSYQYDAVGRITKVTYPDSSTQTYAYDVPNNTVTYTDEAGSSWLCTYGNSGKLLTVKDLTSNKVLESYTYDHLDHLVKKVTYGESTPNQTAYYRYGTDGRVIEQGNLNASGSKIYQELYEYTYQGDSEKVKKTIVGDSNAPSVVTTSYHDNMGNVVKTGRILNGTEYVDTFAYDYLGNQTQARSAYSASLNDAYSTKTTYDYAGRVLTTTNNLGQTASKTYDWMGNLLTDTDPKGNVTRYTYDVLGRLIRVTAPLDSGRTSQTDYTYDPNGNITEERTRTGSVATSTTARVTAYEYDDTGRVIQVKGNGKEDGKSGTNQFQYTQYVYDKLGNVTKMYTGLHAPLTISSSGSVSSGGDSNYSVTQYAYDRYARLIQQTDALGKSETYTYDLNGNLATQKNRRGVTTKNTFDAMGRITRSVADADYLQFYYTPTNQLREAKTREETTTYTYDELGRLISEKTPHATKTFTYNIGDLRTSFTVADDTTTYLNNTYTYDKVGRLKTVNGSGAQATYAYDANGNLSSTTYNNNTTATYTYNSGNLPTQVQNKKGSTLLSRYSYTYGLDGNQLTKTDNLGRATTYTYDGLNRLTKEVQTGSGSFTNSYVYDDYSNRATATLAGTAASYTYDANNRLLANTQGKNATSYTYDNQGNMTSAVFKYNGTVQNTLNCTYDGFGHLQIVSDSNGETVYTYDASGKRSSKKTADGIQYYIWDGDQLAVAFVPKIAPFFTFTASDSGAEDNVSVPIQYGTTYYAKVNGIIYSAVAEFNNGQAELFSRRPDDDDPIPIDPPDPPDPVNETYTELNIGGFVFLISNSTGKGIVGGPAGRTIELYANDPSTTLPTTSYVRGLSLVAAVQDGTPTYYHYNAHGDVVQLTDSSGNVTKNYNYDAFGVEKNASASDTNPFRYCGEQYDSETGNYYLRARYYSPGIGRFTQEDTHWNPSNMIYGDEQIQLHAYTYSPHISSISQAGNLYFYALNNPVAYQDPSGDTAYVDSWVQNAQSLPSLDGPYPYTDAIYAIGTGIAFLIDLALLDDAIDSSGTTPKSDSSSRRGGGFSKEAGRGGGFSQSAIGSGETAGGGPRKDPDKNRQFKKLSTKEAKEIARKYQYKRVEDLKKEYVGSEVSKFDLKCDPKTGRIFLVEKYGELVIETFFFK